MKPKFVHLSVCSDYSITRGLNTPKDLVKHAYTLGMPALGILDDSNFYGVVKFYKNAMKYGIKPIFGVRMRIKFNFIPNEFSIIKILAINDIGYRNLMVLISKSRTEFQIINNSNKKYFFILQDWLVNYREGLIILSGGVDGDFGKYAINKNYSLVYKLFDFYNKYFLNFYYIEINRTNRIYEKEYILYAIEIASLYHVPIVATNDVCFIHKIDFDTHRIKLAIDQRVMLSQNCFDNLYSTEQFMKTETQMCDLFSDIPSSLKNSVEIAKRCNVSIPTGNYFLPSFPTNSINAKEFLIQKSIFGLKSRLNILFPNINDSTSVIKKYYERLFMELKIINKMNFPSYFLIVMEFVQWAKKNNIPVGPGRGSGAGSLVAYALNITEIDPLKFDLIFERFLNPERLSMPDFDIDFCMEKRDIVIEHVKNFYGSDRVAQIITFGTMSARSVIRDVGRVLGYPYGFVNKIAQLIPMDIGITLKQALSKQCELLELFQKNVEVNKLINISKKLEGVTRNTGKHAGGIVISPQSLVQFTPLQNDENMFITQLDKDDINYIGLLKFDFLGLRTLTIINSAVCMINSWLKKNNQDNININHIKLNDEKSFDLLRTGNTIAVFQLESYGIRNLILKLKPDCFEDIISLIALFRPGPLQSGMVDNFINRKHGKENIYYPDKKWQHISLKPILESTYGIILYQEQVMQIAQVFAGYTLSKADILQRAMSKKKHQVMADQRIHFQYSAKKNGMSNQLSSKIFDLLEKFSGYGFNKSHSSAYALISYQTLWLKSNYPSEFMAAVMSADLDNLNKIKISIYECLKMNIKILPPDINQSKYFFIVNQDRCIVYGLGAIKGLGKAVIQNILSVRKRIGKFNSFFEFCVTVQEKFINKRILEKLIFSGSFDCFKIKRFLLISLIPFAIQLSDQYRSGHQKNQLQLFQSMHADDRIFRNKIQEKFITAWTNKLKLDYEKDVLGFYLTGDPLSEYLYELNNYVKNITVQMKKKNITTSVVIIFGIISNIRSKYTKNKKNIMFLEITRNFRCIEVIVFNNFLVLHKNIFKKDKIVIIVGKYISDHSIIGKRILLNNIIDIDSARNKYVKKIILLINQSNFYKTILLDIKNILKNYSKGFIPIYIFYRTKNSFRNYKFQKCWNITLSEELIVQLKNILGNKCVYLSFK
ncbi:DNA polymerase III subunit alpha [Buchnera aphidicola]|uniref:DNA polymerase III subunit alpha n=1 Tax=Buchnera aphidicola TaxID=9 RepID=UPI0031B88566